MGREDSTDAEDSDTDIIVHEALSKDTREDELEKGSRTVFLSNVSSEAVVSRKAKKSLLAHLSSVLDKSASPPQSIVSLRFRSVPFSTAAMPKRAAYITKALMDATTKSTHAYAVFSAASAARLAVSTLNGSVVLDRHLRVDSVAHPSPTDQRRCVFVGNLGFVDDETVFNTKIGDDGKEQVEQRKRTKTPMDVEEGLWRTFGKHAGKVENVRVVRDPTTRVGKGIAYVQFYVSKRCRAGNDKSGDRANPPRQDGNSVEAALLLAGKKFPPLLPRELRVSRCKAPHKTARAVERSQQQQAKALSTGTKSQKYVPKLTPEEQYVLIDPSTTPRRPRGRPNTNTGVCLGRLLDGLQSYLVELQPSLMAATAAKGIGRGRAACRVENCLAKSRSRHRRP